MQAESTCINCARYKDTLKCEAFPNGIPKAILEGWQSHTSPFKGDNGVRFKPIEVEK